MAMRIAALVGIVLGLVGLGIDFDGMVPFSMVVSSRTRSRAASPAR